MNFVCNRIFYCLKRINVFQSEHRPDLVHLVLEVPTPNVVQIEHFQGSPLGLDREGGG